MGLEVIGTPKDIAFVYAIVLGACLLLYPFINLIIYAVARGVERWR